MPVDRRLRKNIEYHFLDLLQIFMLESKNRKYKDWGSEVNNIGESILEVKVNG